MKEINDTVAWIEKQVEETKNGERKNYKGRKGKKLIVRFAKSKQSLTNPSYRVLSISSLILYMYKQYNKVCSGAIVKDDALEAQ